MLNWVRSCSLTSWNVLLIMCIGVGAIVGDLTVARSTSNTHRAAADSITHGLIGLLTWLIISLNLKSGSTYLQLYEICAAGFFSSFIDIDHFVAAKSLKLKDALNLSSRPFLHCTSVLLFCCFLLITFSNIFEFKYLSSLPWILLASILSHHIRDATRRGFWIWPFGSTPPIPYNFYIIMTMFLPFILIVVMNIFNSTTTKYEHVFDV